MKVAWTYAVREGKEPIYEVYFADTDMTATITIRKGP